MERALLRGCAALIVVMLLCVAFLALRGSISINAEMLPAVATVITAITGLVAVLLRPPRTK